MMKRFSNDNLPKIKKTKVELFTSFVQELVLQLGVKDLNSQECLKRIVKSCSLSPDVLDLFLQDNTECIDWDDVSDLKLDDDFIRKYKLQLNWKRLCKYQSMTECFMIEHSKHLDWVNVSRYQLLSPDFIKKYKDELDWTNLFVHQKLPKKFFEEFQSRVNGKKVFQQELLIKAIQLHVDSHTENKEEEEIDETSVATIDTDSFVLDDE